MDQAIEQLAEEKKYNRNKHKSMVFQRTVSNKTKKRQMLREIDTILSTNSETWWQRYTHIASKYADKLLIARQEYKQRKIIKNKKNSKRLWKVFKTMLGLEEKKSY